MIMSIRAYDALLADTRKLLGVKAPTPEALLFGAIFGDMDAAETQLRKELRDHGYSAVVAEDGRVLFRL